ncbi:DUF861 domain-containing protein [Burkholderia sp. Ac-20344]|nr:DUF861 domain-containing protein [Burkholderia sp. Ac-20344]
MRRQSPQRTPLSPERSRGGARPSHETFVDRRRAERGNGKRQYRPRLWNTEAEYCEILEGTSVIADPEGNTNTVRTGDRFVIPPGFRGTWEVVERTRKIFVAYDEQPPE